MQHFTQYAVSRACAVAQYAVLEANAKGNRRCQNRHPDFSKKTWTNLDTVSNISLSLPRESMCKIWFDFIQATRKTDVTPTARFCRATLSRDKIASVTLRVARLLNSRSTPFPIRAALYSVQLCRENRWTLIGQFLFIRRSCSVRHVMSHLRFLRQNGAIKLQVWHGSKILKFAYYRKDCILAMTSFTLNSCCTVTNGFSPLNI